MVLHHVAGRAGFLEVLAATLHTDRLGHGDLHVVEVLLVPERFEDGVGEPEDQEILDRLFSEIVVDAIDILLAEDFVDGAVQRLGTLQVSSYRFLDDDPRPTFRPSRMLKSGRSESRDDLRKRRRRHRQIEQASPAGSVSLVHRVEMLDDPRVVVRAAGGVRDIGEAALERLPRRGFQRTSRVRLDAFMHHLAEVFGREVLTGDPDDGERLRQKTIQFQVIERGAKLAPGEVTGGTKDHQRAGLGIPIGS